MNMIIFLIFAIISIIINSWFMLWIFMEMNMINFSMFLSKTKKKNNCSMKYYLIQSISSLIFLMIFIFMEKKMNFSKEMMNMIFIFMIMIKSGSYPFFSWMMEISNKISWNKFFMLNSSQKIIPLILLWKFNNNLLINIIFLFNTMIPMMIFKIISNPKKMLMISSFNMFSWLIMLSESKISSLIFLMIYCLCLLMFIMSMSYLNKKININNISSINILINMIIISGVPPFSMFNMKWMSYEIINMNNSNMILFILMLSSISMMFLYNMISFQNFFLEKNFEKKLYLNSMLLSIYTSNFLKN